MPTLSTSSTRRTLADTASAPARIASATGAGAAAAIKPFLRRWMAAGMLLAAALLATLYIANAIAVNSLLADITSLEGERDAVRRENEKLRSELLRLMSVDRVTASAGKFGLVLPPVPPQSLGSAAAPQSRASAPATDVPASDESVADESAADEQAGNRAQDEAAGSGSAGTAGDAEPTGSRAAR